MEDRFILYGANGRPFLVSFTPSVRQKYVPLIIFAHGFKGFMDWGHFPLMAKKLAEQGFAVARFNFSHNGTTPETPTEFSDLEAFGKNTYTKELFDLDTVITYFYENSEKFGIDKQRLFLMGHSRGGALVLLKAASDKRIKRVIALAPVSDLAYKWTEEEVKKWKEQGVTYVYNSRTEQNMPLYIDLLEDYYDNKNLLDLQKQMTRMQKPNLIIHARDDKSVPIEHAARLMLKNPYTRLIIYQTGGHTFGGKHPWKANELPTSTLRMLEQVQRFFLKKRQRLMDVKYKFR